MTIKRSQKVGENLFGDIEEELRILYPENRTLVGNNLIGQSFGKLKVLYRIDNKTNTIYWMCKCCCGSYFIASSTFLNKGVPNCGCLSAVAKERRKESKKGPQFVFDGEFLVLQPPTKIIRTKHGRVLSTERLVNKNIKIKEIKGSRGEMIIASLLRKSGIEFTREFRVSLPDGSFGRFDFYVEGKYFIEYDGEQHFQVVDKWGGVEGLHKRMEKDALKNEYCMNERIPLIRIPYTEKEIVLDDLKLETTHYLFYNGEEVYPNDAYYLCHENENSVFSRVDFESNLL